MLRATHCQLYDDVGQNRPWNPSGTLYGRGTLASWSKFVALRMRRNEYGWADSVEVVFSTSDMITPSSSAEADGAGTKIGSPQ